MAYLPYITLFLFSLSSLLGHGTAFSFSDGQLYNGSPEHRSEVSAFIASSKLASANARMSRVKPRSPNYPLRSLDLSEEAVAVARNIVEASICEAAEYNKARVQSTLHSSPGRKRDNHANYPLMTVNSTVASAAALIAEVDAGKLSRAQSKISELRKRSSMPPEKREASTYWLGEKTNYGTWPYGSDSTYQVFRNVMHYGAVGDGVTDDTAAINLAISDGGRCGANCESSSVKGALVFFPPGTYLVSGSINAYYNTQLVGDPTSVPTIMASSSFVGLGVISTDYYINGGSSGPEWYLPQSNFYRQIRNFNINIINTNQNAYICAIHYQVAQATSIQNVLILASTESGTTQQGIYTENGSGGFMTDMVFFGGNFGLYGGNQQFTARNMIFLSCVTAIQLTWDWGWTWQGIRIQNTNVGISLIGQDGSTRGTGSLMLVDSTFTNVATAILTFTPLPGAGQGTTGISLSNVAFSGVTSGIKSNTGTVYLAGSVTSIDTFTIGTTYDSTNNRAWTTGTSWTTTRDSALTYSPSWDTGLPNLPYFEQSMNQYLDTPIDHVTQFKWLAKGDGVTDDTSDIQAIFDFLADNPDDVGFIDAGSYVISDTVTLPVGANIVGECWAQLVASGPKFQDSSKPTPLLKVGSAGDIGNVSVQQLLFTTTGPTEGLVAVEWNVQAASQGSASLWDSHVRIGGALGSDLQLAQCPNTTISNSCIAGSLMFHVTSGASGYFENMWLWTADHDIDDPLNTQLNILVGRGMLIESSAPVWLYGTASEHAALYQYQFEGANTVVAGMIQTETPYYQPNAAVNTLFSGKFSGDPIAADCWPSGSGCDSAYGARFLSSSDITILGAGLYSFFSEYNQACIATQNCQSTLVSIDQSYGGIEIYNLNTIGAVNMVTGWNLVTNQTIPAAINTNPPSTPYWSSVSHLVGDVTTSTTKREDNKAQIRGMPWHKA